MLGQTVATDGKSALRLMVFDRTCARHRWLPLGLSDAWRAGGALYRGVGRLDAAFGAASWHEALAWLGSFEPARFIAEVQYWGHGKWGRIFVGDEPLDRRSFEARHPHRPGIDALRARLVPDGLVWLRTCEAFGAQRGVDFAMVLADALGVRAAGHTFVIGALQSGLRALRPGHRPTWSATEGLEEGTAEAPLRAYDSGVRRPRTITCLRGDFPERWFDEDSGPA